MWLYSDTDPKGHQSKSISKLPHLKPQILGESVKALTFAIPVGLCWVFCVFEKKTAEKELKKQDRAGEWLRKSRF